MDNQDGDELSKEKRMWNKFYRMKVFTKVLLFITVNDYSVHSIFYNLSGYSILLQEDVR